MDLSHATPLKDGNVFTMVAADGSLPIGVFMDDHRYVMPWSGRGRWRIGRRGFAEVEVTGADAPAPEPGDLAHMLSVRGFAGATADPRRGTSVSRDGNRIRFEFAPTPPAQVRPELPRAHGVLGRAYDDLRMLLSSHDGLHFFAAGVPWYVALFGRDSLITAHQTLHVAPDIARDTLRLLARYIGTDDDPRREEQPGKILHEFRSGEAGDTPLARYYGSVDATPLWLCVLAEYVDHTGDRAILEELRAAIEAATTWLGDGLLTYEQHDPGGLRNQGWKDSPDGIPHEDGTPLEPPIALVEAQGYAIRAKRDIGRLTADDALLANAERHAQELERRFWLADENRYALALDRDGRPSTVVASNQGHLLWARAVPLERAQAIRDSLMHRDSFSGHGIRTLAGHQVPYDALSYHRGSVWPHDTAMIAHGLRAYGFHDDADRIADAVADAARSFPDQRLPELYGGDDPPSPYPVACQPQAWAAGAVIQLLTSRGAAEDGSSPA